MSNITEIEGIGPAFGAKLSEAGVDTLAKLLEMGGSQSGRSALAQKTGVTEKQLLEWVNRADLDRVKGIGSEYADLLEAAGVDSPAELAQRNAANLTHALVEINTAKQLVRRVPNEAEVQDWIDHAKTLPKVVTH